MAEEKTDQLLEVKEREQKEVSFIDEKGRKNGSAEARSRPSTRQSQKSSASLPVSDMSYDTLRTKFLTSRHMPLNQSPIPDRKRKKRKKKGRKTPVYDEEEEREAKRLQELQESLTTIADNKESRTFLRGKILKHMQVMEDLNKLKDHYYSEYMSALNDKVVTQRKEIQQRTDDLNKKILEKQEKERAEKRAIIKKKFERSSLINDSSFAKSIPKTQWYRIIALQDKMIKEGVLKSQGDIDEFWHEMSVPEKYNEKFGFNVKSNDASLHGSSSTISVSSHHSSDKANLPADSFIPMVQIEEDREPSRPSTKGAQSWAVTQQFKKNYGYLSTPVKGRRTSIHPKALAVDQRFPKVELPPLATFTLDLSPKKDDPEILKMTEEFRIRAKIRERERRRLRMMYEYALAHQAATHRILNKKEEFGWIVEGPSIGELISGINQEPEMQDYPVLPSPPPPHSDDLSLPNLDEDDGTSGYLALPSTSSKPGPLSAIEEMSEEHRSVHSGFSRDSSRKSASSGKSRQSSGKRRLKSASSISSDVAPRPPPKPLPLTMNEILDDCVIKEAKCLSTLWTNYSKDATKIAT
ncbi:uncharacterized protein LOC100371866 [Saccoglossus kowalevskii]|uniref:Biorientation of chromosomes in cell division protein 1-like 1-like n=1 Tax=Saccoglossus kowalevskii TaxID=10224 RepID=A0ABM0M641_SACKO|nr:PREDICTED: biorientation of chromosomes in cell division protein 1-like 1-like [Saccoglossus kowalevskii]